MTRVCPNMTHSEKQQHQQMQRAAGALGGKTVRACDGCARRRARWYCGADDAFLCQACDASVHSANPLARRHERLRLKTSSPSVLRLDAAHAAGPTWHHGIIRKARTRRPKPAVAAAKSEPLVPDLETASADENNPEEEQLLYRVPIFDPVLAEFCSPPPTAEDAEGQKQMAQQLDYSNYADGSNCEGLVSFLPADDADLAEFAADMETLLGRGIEDGAFCMEGLGLIEAKAESGVGDASKDCNRLVKMEANDDSYQMDAEFDAPRETLELNFDCGSPAPIGDDDKDEQMASAARRVTLRLDYEAVITAWSSSCQGSSPWTDGERPQINPDVCWPDYMVGQWGGGEGSYAGSLTGHMAVGGDGGREARVTRYREKRRTRLFAKKIRYEVRKLNAEKRPRMKGRFVKRSSFPPAAPATGVPSFQY